MKRFLVLLALLLTAIPSSATAAPSQSDPCQTDPGRCSVTANRKLTNSIRGVRNIDTATIDGSGCSGQPEYHLWFWARGRYSTLDMSVANSCEIEGDNGTFVITVGVEDPRRPGRQADTRWGTSELRGTVHEPLEVPGPGIPGLVGHDFTLTVTEGTNEFAGASGTLEVTGVRSFFGRCTPYGSEGDAICRTWLLGRIDAALIEH